MSSQVETIKGKHDDAIKCWDQNMCHDTKWRKYSCQNFNLTLSIGFNTMNIIILHNGDTPCQNNKIIDKF